MKTLNQFNFETGELYRAVVESSTDAIITKSLDGTIRSWNKSAERIFGYTAEEAIGQSVLLLIPEDHHNEESDIIRRIKAGERVDHFETIRRRKDGTRIPISLTISPIKNSAGNIVGASKVARDITSQKEYESQLIAQADELEQFAYVASHDLREPLRKVAVYTELLTEKTKTATTPETTKYADFILESVTRMQRLISGLLDYSRANRLGVR
jgi:PAS domain S-box-containing protein